MGKKQKQTLKREEEKEEEINEEKESDTGGFPDDIDFKKFLGCGG